MAVNKNFVIKNGLEVNTNLILADAFTNRVGIGSTIPDYTLDVIGGIGAEDLYVSGVTTIFNELRVGSGGTTLTAIGSPGQNLYVGVGTAEPAYLLDIRSPVSTGQTALYVKGDAYIEGNLNVNFDTAGGTLEVDSATITDATLTDINNVNFNSSGISTVNDLEIDGRLYDVLNSTGTAGQYLKSTGTGVEWESFGVYRNQQTFISTEGQTVYNFLHQSGQLDVYLNGVKLIETTEFTGDESTVTLVTPAFEGDIVEMISLVNSEDLILIDGATITLQENGTNVGLGSVLNFIGEISVITPGPGVIGVATITTGVSTTFNITASSSSDVVFPTFAAGIGSTTISVSESNLTFIPSEGKLGIGTELPKRTLEVTGDIAISNQIYATTLGQLVTTATGTLDSANRDFIGVNTSQLQVGYVVVETTGENEIPAGTQITSIGIGSIGISNLHRILVGSATTNLSFSSATELSPGLLNQVLVSRGSTLPSFWADASEFIDISVTETSDDQTFYGVFSPVNAGITTLSVNAEGFTFNPSTNSLGIGTSAPSTELEVVGDVTAVEFFGSGINLSGIVTQITAGIGVTLTPSNGQGNVEVNAYKPIGKTIFVSQTGDDANTGLSENHPKRTIKAAAAIAFPGDTVKVYPGVYVENNPIQLSTRVSVEGTELRNCIVTPRYLDRDLFHVNNSCHVTDLSFVSSEEMTNGAAIIALQPLLGVSTDRFFDASRMIRYNLDYIAKESVGFLTSGFSGFAGNHREQDAARLIDLNIDFIAAESIGFLTSTDYKNPAFTVVNTSGIATDPVNCSDDIKDILRSISYDLKAGSNKKVIGAGLSYYDDGGTLLHITGISTGADGNQSYSVKEATVAAINHAVGIVTHVINNVSYGGTTYSSLVQDTSSYSPILVSGGCTDTIDRIETLAGVVTSIIDDFNNAAGITTVYGVTLESGDCSDDVKDIWKCVIHDITRGGNSKCVSAGKSYYDADWNLIPQILKNPGEVEQTIATVDYSFGVARAVINNSTWGGYPVGLGTAVTNALYDNATGLTTITAINHGLSQNDAVKIVGLGFTCPSGPGIVTYPSGNLGFIFNVNSVVGPNTIEVVVGQSTLPHNYVSGGTVQKYTNFQNNFTQVKDFAMQPDPDTGYNNAVNGCSDVVSAIRSCVGVVTTIVGLGSESGITTSYPGNAGIGFTSTIGITGASYDNESGNTTIVAPNFSVKSGDIVEVRDLLFECASGGTIGTQAFPSGRYGYLFDVVGVTTADNSFTINTGVSTIPHDYVSGGFVVNRSIGVTTASYDNVTGITTITAPGAVVKIGQFVRIHDLEFSCTSGAGTTTLYPTGNLGYEFKVVDILPNDPVAVSTAVYNNVTGITTITAPGFEVSYNDLVEIRNLEFTCPDSPPNLLYPSGNNGYSFRVLSSIGSTFTVNVGPSTIPHTYVSGGTVVNLTTPRDTFTINTGVSTIPHTYVGGGVVFPAYSPGVGNITQGPYVRNCTNFVPSSIGMKIDGFEAEPGDQDDIGVTGTMSVDSYTQYNQGGIGVSITNGAYAQLVSIFTICDDIAIFTGSGGQCDITNSNSSFGRLGLFSNGVGDYDTKSIYRYTGVAATDVEVGNNIIPISGIGTNRPYDGQVCYFGDLYYFVDSVQVDSGGSGYTVAPKVTFSTPEGENGITAQASTEIDAFGRVTAVNIVNSGTQYLNPPTVTIDPPAGIGVTATASVSTMQPIYYKVDAATLPSSGISTVSFLQTLNNTVSAGTTVYFTRVSLQITSSHSFEWVGSGNNIDTAKPALGGVVIPENEVVQTDGGIVIYTSTDQAGNFRIGDGVVINQATGQLSGRDFTKALFTTMTPFILALAE